MKRKAWYVPLKKIDQNYLVPEELESIKPAFCDINSPINEFKNLTEKDLQIKEGQPFKVELISFFIGHNYDGNRSNNDLLVQTRTKYGSKLRTNAVNFFQKNIPLNHVKLPDIGSKKEDVLVAPYIYGVNTHDPLNRLHIEVEIQEIDRNTISDDSFIRASKGFVSELGGFFPDLLKYYTGGIKILEKIDDIFKLIDPNPNKTVFRESIDLYRLGLGETPLRQGIYILFSGTRDARKLLLHDNDGARGAMYTWKDHGISPIKDGGSIWDHVAIAITPCTTSDLMLNDLLLNQDASTLIAPFWSNAHKDIENATEKIKELKKIIADANKIELLKNLETLYKQIQQKQSIDKVLMLDQFADNLIEQAKADIYSYIPEEWMSLFDKLSQAKKLRDMYKMLIYRPKNIRDRLIYDEKIKNFPNDIQREFILETIDILSEFIPEEEIKLLKDKAGIQ